MRSRDAVKILHRWSWAHGFHGHSDDDGASETSEDGRMPGYAFLEQFGDAVMQRNGITPLMPAFRPR